MTATVVPLRRNLREPVGARLFSLRFPGILAIFGGPRFHL